MFLIKSCANYFRTVNVTPFQMNVNAMGSTINGIKQQKGE